MANPKIRINLATKQIAEYLRDRFEGIAKQGFAVIISTDVTETEKIIGKLIDPENGLGFQTVNIHSFDSLEKARNFINNNDNVLIVINRIKQTMQQLQRLMPACEISGDVLSNVPQTAAEIHTWL